MLLVVVVILTFSLPSFAWRQLWPESYSFSAGLQFGNSKRAGKEAFVNDLVERMSVEELVMQLHLMFADNVVGPKSSNELYDFALRPAPPSTGLGVMHDWYPTSADYYNTLQQLNLNKSRLQTPFMLLEECVHGVGSFKQSMFPHAIALAASWDEDLVWRVGRAIGTEARAIGIHGCFAPVLDLGKDVRWGRVQEAWGEDYVFTSHMGVAFASGLSKNGSWADPDAVVPVMKHFAAHGSPRGGINAAPFMGRGHRQVMMEMLIPFRDAVQKGFVKGVMMAYHEYDEIPAHVNPVFYDALEDWGFDGFVIADDTGMRMLHVGHKVSNSDADTIAQWFNAGGMLQFYDYSYETYLNVTKALIANSTISLSTIQSHAARILAVKHDLGLFDNPYVPHEVDYQAITQQHVPLTLEAAQKAIVLLENKNQMLPLQPNEQGIKTIALIGPFGDQLNYGDYSGPWGSTPVNNSNTIREAMLGYLAAENVELLTSTGANTFLYNAPYPIPTYLLSPPSSEVTGGLKATYFADTNFSEPVFTTVEAPNRDWGLYPPLGLPSNNFSVIWEGEVTLPFSDTSDIEQDIHGFIGISVSPNTTARLYIDSQLVAESPFSSSGTIMGNIMPLAYSLVNATSTPLGGSPFVFEKARKKLSVRVEFQTWNLYQKIENLSSLNAQVQLWWNLVDQRPGEAVRQAVAVAEAADIVVLAVGANWNSDGESGDRATLGLPANQTVLADAIFALGKPVVLVLEGGRPFAIPEFYSKCAAAVNALFPGQQGGQAIADVLFGKVNPGGRIPLSVPYGEGTLPSYYNYHPTAHAGNYIDVHSFPTYSFGYGLSYSAFSTSDFNAASSGSPGGLSQTFAAGETIHFHVKVTNKGPMAGSYVAQIYLLQRVSTIVRAERQLVAFKRVYLDVGESEEVKLDLEVDRFLPIVNRRYQWELEKGNYTFALLDHGGPEANPSVNVTLNCI
ncbi:glycoside hydrolase family 3 domain protein [Moniliophthora roreri MCA 2997]|uniref:xylan 1,4-beta-xylosidase n=1 Tax=Moniliophthora roreri (strain MCA 2997) TaxID=1381753 RepID=V2X6V1_MONRO|nr:glycoside hydrolase family 3 domain protein [Moniliophthora roreri MCA 2997]